MARFLRSCSDDQRAQARTLRQSGLTYSEIVAALGGDIPKTTLQGWVRDVELTAEQRERIRQKEREAVAKAQSLGAQWNREQKQRWLEEAEEQTTQIVRRLLDSRDARLLMAVGLYLGEGRKTDTHLAFTNSDPNIIRAWIDTLRSIFELDENRFACQVNISEGMDDEACKAFWSEVTIIPLSKFQKSGVKKAEAVGRIRRNGYKGTCTSLYYSTEHARYFVALSRATFDAVEKTDKIQPSSRGL